MARYRLGIPKRTVLGGKLTNPVVAAIDGPGEIGRDTFPGPGPSAAPGLEPQGDSSGLLIPFRNQLVAQASRLCRRRLSLRLP
jgi:hypothetical protein